MPKEGGKRVGVLAIQGSVEEHFRCFEKLDCEVVLVKKARDLEGIDLLVIPGGESTTIGKLMWRFGLAERILELYHGGMWIWGTCAGAILLAKEVVGNEVEGLGLMNMKVERNAYGGQLDSFECVLGFAGKEVEGVFIRAPKILEVGGGCEVLGEFEEDIVAAVEERLLATTFHPEMTEDLSVQRWLLEKL